VPDLASFSVGIVVRSEIGERPPVGLAFGDQLEDLVACVLDALVLHAVGKGDELDLFGGLVGSSETFGADRRIRDRMAHGVIERCSAPRLEGPRGERPHGADGRRVGEDFVRVLSVELDQGHDGVFTVRLLSGQESIEAPDHVRRDLLHRPGPIE